MAQLAVAWVLQTRNVAAALVLLDADDIDVVLIATPPGADVRTIGVNVSNQDDAIAFYVDTLGFQKRLDTRISPTMRWVEVAPAGASTSIALQANEAATGVTVDTGIRFTVPDAQAEHAAMRARGVHVGDILRWDGVPPMYSFDDPGGNHFSIVEASR